MQKYYLQWKGVETGPFSESEIVDMYDTGKIGLLHHVRSEGDSDGVFLRDFLKGVSPSQKLPANANSKKSGLPLVLIYMAYGLCGASFLSIYVWIFAMASAAILWFCGERKNAVTIGIVSSIMAAGGAFFFQIIIPVIVK